MFVVFWEWVFLRRRLVLLFIDIMFMIFRVMSRKDWLSCAIRLYIQSFQSSEIINWLSGPLYAFPFQKTKVVIWALFPYLHLLFLFVCLSWLHHWDCNDGQRRVLLSCLKLDRNLYCIENQLGDSIAVLKLRMAMWQAVVGWDQIRAQCSYSLEMKNEWTKLRTVSNTLMLQDDYALQFHFKACVNIRSLINHCQN